MAGTAPAGRQRFQLHPCDPIDTVLRLVVLDVEATVFTPVPELVIGSETVDVEPKLDKVGNLHPGDPGPHKMVKDSIVAVKCVHYLHPGPLGPGIPDIVVPALAPYRAVLHVRPSVRQRIPALKTSPPSFILLLHGFLRRDMAALTTKVAPQGAGTKDNKGNNDKIFVFLRSGTFLSGPDCF